MVIVMSQDLRKVPPHYEEILDQLPTEVQNFDLTEFRNIKSSTPVDVGGSGATQGEGATSSTLEYLPRSSLWRDDYQLREFNLLFAYCIKPSDLYCTL